MPPIQWENLSMNGQHIAAGLKHPDNMNRKEKIQFITTLKKSGDTNGAYKFWINHGGRISRATFEEL